MIKELLLDRDRADRTAWGHLVFGTWKWNHYGPRLAARKSRQRCLYELAELGLQPDSSLKDLAESIGVSPSALSVMVQSLVERGLVTRVADPADRRRIVLRLSADGERTMARLEDGLVDRFDAYLDELDPTTRTALADASRTMLDVVQRIMRRDESRTEE